GQPLLEPTDLFNSKDVPTIGPGLAFFALDVLWSEDAAECDFHGHFASDPNEVQMDVQMLDNSVSFPRTMLSSCLDADDAQCCAPAPSVAVLDGSTLMTTDKKKLPLDTEIALSVSAAEDIEIHGMEHRVHGLLMYGLWVDLDLCCSSKRDISDGSSVMSAPSVPPNVLSVPSEADAFVDELIDATDSFDPFECDTLENILQNAEDIIQRHASNVDSHDVLRRDFNMIAEPAVPTLNN
ncbi:unnamed protein product, partial [Prorocentrum cordatum]